MDKKYEIVFKNIDHVAVVASGKIVTGDTGTFAIVSGDDITNIKFLSNLEQILYVKEVKF